MNTSIYVTSSFIGFHRWPEAPDEVAFLRSTHRHVFKVRVELAVTHDDRQLEFFIVKRELDALLALRNDTDLGASSCEHLAKMIMAFLSLDEDKKVLQVEVSEDGENGAIVKAEVAVPAHAI